MLLINSLHFALEFLIKESLRNNTTCYTLIFFFFHHSSMHIASIWAEIQRLTNLQRRVMVAMLWLTITVQGSEQSIGFILSFCHISVVSSHLCSGTEISAEVDEVELEDGAKIQPISVIFPEGNTIPAHEQVRSCTQTSLPYYHPTKNGSCVAGYQISLYLYSTSSSTPSLI